MNLVQMSRSLRLLLSVFLTPQIRACILLKALGRKPTSITTTPNDPILGYRNQRTKAHQTINSIHKLEV